MSPVAPARQALRHRLNRIEGQVRGIGRMIEEGSYCLDILTQVAATTRALQSLGLLLADEHLHHCLDEEAGPARAEKITEVSQAIARVVRS